MAKPSEPKPKLKNITKKKIVGSGRGMDKADKKAWKGVQRKTEPTNTVKRK